MNHTKQSGFTLVEMIVAIAILALLISTGIIGYRYHQKRVTVRLTAERFVSEARKQQSNALGMVLPADEDWAIGIESDNEYFLFKDKDLNHYYNSGDSIEQTISLPTDIVFNRSGNKYYIAFEPASPMGQFHLYSGTAALGNTLDVIIENTNVNTSYTIRLDKISGRIEIIF